MFLSVRRQHRQRGSDCVESAIEERSVSFRNKQLMELIRHGISRRYQDAKQRAPWLPEPSPLFHGKTVKKKGEDAIFN